MLPVTRSKQARRTSEKLEVITVIFKPIDRITESSPRIQVLVEVGIYSMFTR